MNDLYLELSQSKVGKNIFEALNLPQPPELIRDSETPLNAPTGRVLIASVQGGFINKTILSSLNIDSVTLCEPNISSAEEAKLFSRIDSKGVTLESVNLSANSKQKFKHLILDASNIRSSAELKSLYAFFSVAMKHIKQNGRMIILTASSDDKQSVIQQTIVGAIEGFVRSLAKEIGRKGISCNSIAVEKGSERHIKAPLFYLMSDRSAFVTGQTLKVSKQSGTPRKIDWDQPLKGKTALVTGAAQGIGAETAETLARNGAQVVCLDIPSNLKKLETLCQHINGHPLALDLSEETSAKTLSSTIASQLGLIDIIVHNAGITRDKTLRNMPEHFWDQVLTINLERIIEINQTLIEKSLIAKKGRIVCVSSISGIAGNFGQTNYACSKAGIAKYVEAMSQDNEHDFTINAVAPGFIETDMIKKIPPMSLYIARRSNTFSQGGLTADVAEAIGLFCHPASQSLNGNVLRVCGQNIVGK